MEANTIVSLKLYKGKKVLGNTGNECGIIKDFLIDPNTRDVKFIIIVEGNLSSNQYYIAPFGAMTLESPLASQQTLKMPIEKILTVPTVPKEGNAAERTSFYEKIKAYYGEELQGISYRDAAQTYEGSSQISNNIPLDNHEIGDEVAYYKVKERRGEKE